MHIKFLAITSLLSSLSSPLIAQQNYSYNTDKTQYIRLKIENDVLVFRDKTDRYYTSGVKLNYVSEEKAGASKVISKIFPKIKLGKNNYGFTVSTNMFTPSHNSEMIVQGDRPYCGWAYLGFTNTSNDSKNGLRFSSEYSIGALGPITQQERMQKSVHKFIERPQPRGWKNQIANDVALNLNFIGEKYIMKPLDNIELIGLVETNVGTVTNYMGFGGIMRVGWFENYFNKIMPLSTKKRWQTFVFTRPVLRIIADNSLLQGGYFNYYKSPYVISRDDINHWYLETEFGYSFSYRSFNFTYSQNFRTSEFKDAKNMFWGAVTMTTGF